MITLFSASTSGTPPTASARLERSPSHHLKSWRAVSRMTLGPSTAQSIGSPTPSLNANGEGMVQPMRLAAVTTAPVAPVSGSPLTLCDIAPRQATVSTSFGTAMSQIARAHEMIGAMAMSSPQRMLRNCVRTKTERPCDSLQAAWDLLCALSISALDTPKTAAP